MRGVAQPKHWCSWDRSRLPGEVPGCCHAVSPSVQCHRLQDWLLPPGAQVTDAAGCL